MAMWFQIVAYSLAFAQPVLGLEDRYEPDLSRKDPIVSVKQLENYTAQMRMEFSSFDAQKLHKPLMVSVTKQKLYLENKKSKKGAKRFGVRFLEFSTEAKLPIPGSSQPFETKQDFGETLAGRELIFSLKNGSFDKIENLQEFREGVKKDLKNGQQLQMVLAAFTPEILGKSTSSNLKQTPCHTSIKNKKPGSSWEGVSELDGMRIPFSCLFEGWAKGFESVALLSVKFPPSRHKRSQPDGTPGNIESKGTGRITIDTKSGEFIYLSENDILAEPSEDEIKKIDANRGKIPRNQSFIKNYLHYFP